MQEEFKSWKALYRAVNDENTVWGQLQAHGEEILVYKNRSRHLLLSTEPVEDHNWTEVEL